MIKQMKTKQIPILCGTIDCLITLLLTFVFAALLGHWPWEVITKIKGYLLFSLLISLIAGHRGFINAQRGMIGDSRLVQPVKEGFIIGFFPIPIIHGYGILQEALAGPESPWPSIGYSPISEWLKYIFYTFCLSIVCGMIGAIYGLFLSRINRVILKKIESTR